MITSSGINRKLQIIQEFSQKKVKINGLYKLLTHRYIWEKAFEKAIQKDSLESSFPHKNAAKIIQLLKDNKFSFRPVKRVFISKANGKQRPVGILTQVDRALQQSMKLLIDTIYQPIFSRHSHGFRPKRSTHTALHQIKKEWKSVKYFVKLDIEDCFDSINHSLLLKLLNDKIEDDSFIQLIKSFLKSGYSTEGWFHPTPIGVHQGAIISPLLANIYLHELDCFVDKNLCHRGKNKDQVYYCRYADDLLIGTSGDENKALQLKADIKEFLNNQLHLKLAERKTVIKPADIGIHFLNYGIKNSGEPLDQGFEEVEFFLPEPQLFQFAIDKGYGNLKTMSSNYREDLFPKWDNQIISLYNSELRGFTYYYHLIDSVPKNLKKMVKLARNSLVKTYARKHHIGYNTVLNRLSQGSQLIYKYKFNGRLREIPFFDLNGNHKTKYHSDGPSQFYSTFGENSVTFGGD